MSAVLPAGGLFIPVFSGPNPRLQFNAENQQEFATLLRAELVRLGILREAKDDDPSAALKVSVYFPQTYHNPAIQEYVLDVAMEITGGTQPFVKQYRVVSSDGQSFWQKANTNAWEGKARAARMLLEKLVPDIEGYVGSSGK